MDSLPVDRPRWKPKPARSCTRRIHHKHGRAKLPEALPRIPIEHDLKPEEKLPLLRAGTLPHRPGSHRATRIPPRQFQSPPAHPPQVRLQALQSGVRQVRRQGAHRDRPREADRTATPIRPKAGGRRPDCEGPRRAGPAGLRDYQQAGRPSAAVPPGEVSSPARTCISPAPPCAPGCWRPGNWSSRWWT